MSAQEDDCFKQLADGAEIMVWMAGLDMGCFYFNQSWLDFRGRTLEQESGNGWAEGVHPDDLNACVAHYVTCFEARAAFAMSYRLQTAAGDYRWILDRGAPHYLPDGKFLGYFGGCAETEQSSAIIRNAQLGPGLAELQDFARRLAASESTTPFAYHGRSASLKAFADTVHRARGEKARRLKYAAAEMATLAADMAKYKTIRNGERLRTLAA